jgi:hypothetical protein
MSCSLPSANRPAAGSFRDRAELLRVRRIATVLVTTIWPRPPRCVIVVRSSTPAPSSSWSGRKSYLHGTDTTYCRDHRPERQLIRVIG